MKTVSIEDMKGKVFTAIEQTEDVVLFYCDDGTYYKMFHWEDCCEVVYLEDTAGDLQRLIGSPIETADVRYNYGETKWGDSQTWTFYTLATNKDHVVMRWYGTSNGYYSEEVTIQKGETK